MSSAHNNTNSNAFEYETLPTQSSIRLVKLRAKSPIRCDMHAFHINNLPPYQALSYCWGSSDQKANICCDGADFKVSENLMAALQQLYMYAEETGKEWFWIDQLCINQVCMTCVVHMLYRYILTRDLGGSC